MAKHLSFWIGFFVASLMIVPVAVGVWGAAGEFAREVAAFTFGAIAVLVILLVLFLFFRERILRAALGRGEATLDEVTGRLVQTVSAVSSGDRPKAEKEAKALAQTLVGWWAWSNLYRWVIASALGLLLAFGAFTGTVLLFEQTRKLSEQTELMSAQTELMNAQTDRMAEQAAQVAMQNEIMTLNLVNELRSQLLTSVEERPLGEWLHRRGIDGIDQSVARFAAERVSCGVGLEQAHVLRSLPSDAAIAAVVRLSRSELLGSEVRQALHILTQDSHGSVALGALLALGQLSEPVEVTVRVSDVIMFDDVISRTAGYALFVARSFISNVTCLECEVHVTGSVLLGGTYKSLSGGYNLTLFAPESMYGNGIHVVLPELNPPNPSSRTAIPIATGPFFRGRSWTGWLTQHRDASPCALMADIARQNPLLAQQ